MNSTIEAVRAIGNSLIVQLNLPFMFNQDLTLATTPKLDKIYYKHPTHGEVSVTVSNHLAALVDAYNYLIYGKARKV